MEKIENAPQNDDVIVLGVASVETQGDYPGTKEVIGNPLPFGISEE